MLRKRNRALKKAARQPLRKEAMAAMTKLKEEGYSKAQISAQLINPAVGKNKKKGMRDALIKKMQIAKNEKKGRRLSICIVQFFFNHCAFISAAI